MDIEKGTLSVMAKPVAGEWIEDEFKGLKRLGVDCVVSLLERAEQYDVGLVDEQALCLANDIDFVFFPIPDRGLPNIQQALKLVDELFSQIHQGKHAVIHCRAGIGRTGIIAGAVLIKTGISASQALSLISRARGVQVPDTQEQEDWLKSL